MLNVWGTVCAVWLFDYGTNGLFLPMSAASEMALSLLESRQFVATEAVRKLWKAMYLDLSCHLLLTCGCKGNEP